MGQQPHACGPNTRVQRVVKNLGAMALVVSSLNVLCAAWMLLTAGSDRGNTHLLCALLTGVLAVIQFVAGLKCVMLEADFFMAATVVGWVSVGAIWTCCAYPLSLAWGIYALAVTARDDVIRLSL